MNILKIIFLLFVFVGSVHAQSWVYPVGDPNKKPTKSASNSNGYQITRAYKYQGHTGVDLANNLEGDLVRSITSGKIALKCETTESNKSDHSACSGFGNVVIVEHAGGIYSLYAHLKHGSVTSKSLGDSVGVGEKLGEVNCTGYTISSQPNKGECLSNGNNGSHLHFAIKTLNQLGCAYLDPGVCSSEIQYQSDFSIYRNPIEFISQKREESNNPPQPCSIDQSVLNPYEPGYTGTEIGQNSIKHLFPIGQEFVPTKSEHTSVSLLLVNYSANDTSPVTISIHSESIYGEELATSTTTPSLSAGEAGWVVFDLSNDPGRFLNPGAKYVISASNSSNWLWIDVSDENAQSFYPYGNPIYLGEVFNGTYDFVFRTCAK